MDTHFRATYSTIVLDTRGAKALRGNDFLCWLIQILRNIEKWFSHIKEMLNIELTVLTCMDEI